MSPCFVKDECFSQFWLSCACMLSCVRLFVTPWTVAHQAPLSTGFPRQEYWSGLPFPSPEDLPDPGIEPTSLESPALAGGFFTTSATWDTTVAVLKLGFFFLLFFDLTMPVCRILVPLLGIESAREFPPL